MIDLLVNKESKINHQNKIGETALICAIKLNDKSSIDLFLKEKADVNL